ncbi:NB-ARC domain-containing protein [Streptomyces sp. NBC_00154]|uniref:NB-ARC domain-containing protein n=1 Tax=Streptomyces sp. NBC_00154 TaxID=2975670 RepID=UPI002258BC8B|nr:NB-ARC domain-containing protein [Streptomyces sp. NBC_00154]MCX5318083.1 NB-ARC domain-containing protein [Streptomyces sp. NBC_00154]
MTSESPVTVTDTGNAEVTGDGTAVTGYSGPPPDSQGGSPPVEVSGTGDVTVTAPNSVGNSGVIGHLTINAAPRQPAPWPHQVGAIPREAESFQERDETEQLRATMSHGGTTVLCQVVRGTGGVGKTQLAAHYARTTWRDGELDVLVWISASSRPAIISAYAQAAEELLAVEPSDPERSTKQFLAFLDKPRKDSVCRWLVVLDDVTDPADLKELHPPICPNGRTLVTTRRRDAALPGQQINLGMFTPEQAFTYLTRSLARNGRHEDEHQIGALAEDLGYLPLALAQAAAYLIDTGLNCRDYRVLLADQTRRLEELEPDALPDDQPHAVHAAWSLSIERANQLQPAGMAGPMLQLAAMLDPNGIPHDVLTSQPALDHLTADASTSSEHATRRDAERALRVLHRLSLIDHTRDTPHLAVRVHQLTQRAVRDAVPPTEREPLVEAVADALMAAWPDPELDGALTGALRSCTNALLAHAEETVWRLGGHSVLARAANSLGESGQSSAAHAQLDELARAAHRSLSADHKETLRLRGDAEYWRGKAGDAIGAADALGALLPDVTRVLGAKHPSTLIARANLAEYQGRAGDADLAAEALERLLPEVQQALPADDPRTLTLRFNLAHWQGEAGDAAGAAAAVSELWQDRARILGHDHPDTLSAHHEALRWRAESGDIEGAAASTPVLLADLTRVLGQDHPQTLYARGSHAHWQGLLGDAAGAAEAQVKLLQDRLRVFGADHPATLTTRSNLAHWRGTAGFPAEAAEQLEHVVVDLERLYGHDDPRVLTARYNITNWWAKAADSVKTAAAAEKMTAQATRILGADNPETLNMRGQAANWQGDAGDPSAAADAFARLLPDLARVLGPDDPVVLKVRYNIAHWRGEAEDTAGAADAYADALQHTVSVFGPDHRQTAVALHNLSIWRSAAGDKAGTVEALTQLQALAERRLGAQHPDVVRSRSSLAEFQNDGREPRPHRGSDG